MAGFDMDPDRWLSRTRNSDEDLAAHPLFGAHHHPASAAGPLFMDVGGHAFQHGAARQCSDDDFHERRAVNHLDMDDDGDEVLIARAISRRDEMTDSLSAAPPSQQYTEAASTQTLPSQSSLQHYSQESSDSSVNPARLRTDEFLGFWAHKTQPRPAQLPPTPQLQRTSAVCDESPGALVDGIVRAGLDTPSRAFNDVTNFARPGTAFSSFGEGASSTTGTIRSIGASTALPFDSPSSVISAPAVGEKRGNVQYRTVQQYLNETNGQSSNAYGRGVSSRPLAPAPAGAPMRSDVMPIVILEFKMDRRRRFRCPHELAPQLKADDWVVVQLDNGCVDMGSCIEVHQPTERMTIPRHYGHGECGTVLRQADEEDCRVLNEVIPEKEELALAKAHQLVHFLHMPFTCIDAEFQFDLKAVNLYYTLTPQAHTSIMPNVSRLQRELGFLLKAKVHLEQLVPVDG
jgi:hypothetical protein